MSSNIQHPTSNAQTKIPVIAIILILASYLSLAAPTHAFSKKDRKIGEEMHQEILAGMAIYDEPKLNEYLSQVGNRIVRYSSLPDEKFTFTIIDAPEINAFAAPGGYIYVNRGLLNYLTSEAQLAAVLSHEVAHVTERHAARQQRAQTGSNLAAGLLAILSGSADVGEATALWGAAAVRGYGRDMELEADGVGAQFLYKAGYDPQAMIEVVTLLKDQERVSKKRAQESGKKVQGYHGLFATHPRNDKRLSEVISSAGSLPENRNAEHNAVPFRIATDKLVWGKNFQALEKKANRYYQEKLRFRFDYPEDWQFKEENRGLLISGQPEDKSGRLTLEIKPRTADRPDQYIKKVLKIPLIKKSQPFIQARLRGHTGFIPGQNSQPDQRLAVIYYGRGAYIFTGEVLDKAQEDARHQDFNAIIQSFRPISRREISAQTPKMIHYVKATEHTTFAQLSDYLKLGKYGEEELRLINGYYPTGEPQPGEWIKIIQ